MSNKKVLVIGDIMLDVYIYGEAQRLSPEAPCPILEKCNSPSYYLGGAANVALYLKLSGFEVSLYGCIGDDDEGNLIKQLLSHNGINSNLISLHAKTTKKIRFITKDNHQLLRLDRDIDTSPSYQAYLNVLENIDFSGFSSVIISDYDKGFLNEEFCRSVISQCHTYNIPVIVDIKKSFSKYPGATIIKGNKKEIELLSNSLGLIISDMSVPITLKQISEILNSEYVIMTLGEDGIKGYSRTEGYAYCPGSKLATLDVVGAGDVVTAFILMLYLSNEYSFEEILRISNKAAQKKVTSLRDKYITISDVCNISKITTIKELKQIIKEKKIVFTNGCFDVLHAGHVSLLNRAKDYGDILVVAVNSDASIKKLKGFHRPLNKLQDRIDVLSALTCVDYIVVFDDETPLSLIETLKPDILIKGGDYKISEIVGADFVKSYGGEVLSLPLYGTLSSTNIINQFYNG